MTLIKNKRIKLGQIVLFFLWPFLSLINSILNRESFWAKNIFWLFCVFYGYTFVVSSPNIDAYRYIDSFKTLASNTYSFNEFISYLFSGETQYVDIVNPLISYSLSRITSDGRILLSVYGLIFGFFYSRNLWYLFDKADFKYSYITILFFIIFALLDPIWKLGAFRFNVSIQIFLYGFLPLLIDGDKKKVWISISTIFVHFAFFAPVLIILLYLLFRNRQKIYFIIFLFSFLITELNIDYFQNLFVNFPDVFRAKAESYFTPESYENQLAGTAATNWYIRNYIQILKYISASFLSILFIKRKFFFENNNGLKSLWCFTLLFYAFANLVYQLPQGVRFYGVANMLVFFLLSWISSINGLPLIFKRLRMLSIPFLMLIIVVDLRKGFDFTGFLTIFGNPFIAPLMENTKPLISYIKDLFI